MGKNRENKEQGKAKGQKEKGKGKGRESRVQWERVSNRSSAENAAGGSLMGDGPSVL